MVWTIPAENHERRAFMAVILLFAIVDFLCLLVRLYSRHINGNNFRQVSDYVLIFAFVMIVGLVVIIYAVCSHGYGLDVDRFTIEDAIMSSKLFPACMIIWNAATAAIRISMILLYAQIFAPVKSLRYASILLITINLMSFIAIFFTSLLICTPISYAYVRVGHGHCGDVVAFERFPTIVSVVLDASVAILPLPTLWKLQMPTSKKVGITLIVSLGFLICALTVFRLIASFIYMENNMPRQSSIVMFVTGLEPTIGFWIACLPFFPGVLSHIRQSRLYLRLTKQLNTPSSNAQTKMSKCKQTDEMELGLRNGDHGIRIEGGHEKSSLDG